MIKNSAITKTAFILIITTLVFYIPILLNPELILNRGNDLEEQFWPVFYFIRSNFLQTGEVPLWNNLFLSGIPILPDPQFSLFYPFNWLFLIFPTDYAFLLYFLLHTFLAGLGAFLLARFGFKYSYLASMFTAIIYIFVPKSASFLEAGHYGLLATLTWAPFLILSIIKVIKTPTILWSILSAISLAGLFYTHTIIFLIGLITSVILFGCLLIIEKNRQIKKSILCFCLGELLTFGLIAVTLLPQLEWMPNTTRFLLLQDRDVYPKWSSKTEFLELTMLPWFFNISNLQKIENEKLLFFGFITSCLSVFGFWKIKTGFKTIIGLILTIITLIILNNASPIVSFLLSQDWFVLMRVTTRLWIIAIIIVVFLSGFGVDQILKNPKYKNIVYIIILLSILETSFLTSHRMLTPIQKNPNLASQEIYNFLSRDTDKFRVFCTTRCLSQKKAAIHKLELVDGYNTLQQINYYQQSWQLFGGYWNYYTLSIPPIGAYTFEKLQPDHIALGDFNVKYIVSQHKLNNQNFLLRQTIDKYFVYKNLLYKPRAYSSLENSDEILPVKVVQKNPNEIKVEISNPGKQLTLSQIYNSGWKAYLNGIEPIIVQQKPNRLTLVDLKLDTKFVIFKYNPDSYKIGLIITSATLISILLLLLFKLKKLKFLIPFKSSRN